MEAPHRLTLSAPEYAYLVTKLALSMPPGWEPSGDPEPSDLADRGVLRGDGDLLAVHPSVALNLEILAHPKIMLTTTATIGAAGSRSVHAISGPIGGSLFALPDGGIELSMFAATDLGKELIRAVPPEQHSGIDSTLGNGHAATPPRGSVPLAALQELGAAQLFRGVDPQAPAEVLAELELPAAQAELARQVANRTNGALVSDITARVGDDVRGGRVSWLHTDAGWSGIRPDPAGHRMVQLEPVNRADLGVWVAPFVAEALNG
jgi:hypothetical protein